MTLEEAIAVIGELDKHFDSHDFIKKFIFKYPASYGTVLIKHNDVTTSHAEMANFLRLNEDAMSILKTDEVSHKSYDIFGNPTPCSKWVKKN